MSRAAERRAIAAEIDAGRRQTPLEVTGRTPAQDLQPWRPAHVAGTWRNDLSLLIDNRNLDGKPGLWLATPLVLADGTAILVLRGWFARPMTGQVIGRNTGQTGAQSRGSADKPGAEQGTRRIPTPAGVQSVTGELSAHVPRLFELWSLSGGSSGALPAGWAGQAPAQPAITDLDALIRVQNLDIARLEALSGLKFVPAVLLQKNDAGDGLTRVWPEPSVDSDKNVGYAAQWFGFAGIAVIAALGVALRAWRRRAQTA
jgi:cytochrome oxidase assembly protein ShyY1